MTDAPQNAPRPSYTVRPATVADVLISGAVNAFVPAHACSKALPPNPAFAVPVASAAGIELPGCECASVPVAGSLIRRGVTPAAAFAFLLSAPAVNPIVLTATAVAFPGSPEMVGARLIASLAVSAAMGWLWLWLKLGRAEWLQMPARHTGHQDGHSRWEEFQSEGGPYSPPSITRRSVGPMDRWSHGRRRD